MRVPIAHAEGRFIVDKNLQKLVFRKNAADPIIKINEPSIINLGLLTAELIFTILIRKRLKKKALKTY